MILEVSSEELNWHWHSCTNDRQASHKNFNIIQRVFLWYLYYHLKSSTDTNVYVCTNIPLRAFNKTYSWALVSSEVSSDDTSSIIWRAQRTPTCLYARQVSHWKPSTRQIHDQSIWYREKVCCVSTTANDRDMHKMREHIQQSFCSSETLERKEEVRRPKA